MQRRWTGDYSSVYVVSLHHNRAYAQAHKSLFHENMRVFCSLVPKGGERQAKYAPTLPLFQQQTMPKIRVLIVEDTNLVRRLLVHQLSREPDMDVVGEAMDGREAVAQAQKLRPDVIVMDMDMPVMNGLEATERILAQLPGTQILILTMHEDMVSVGRLVGAFETLHKGCEPDDLVAAIRRAFRARQSAPNRFEGSLALEARLERLTQAAKLTSREASVILKVILTELTNEQIAAALSAESGQPVSVSAVKHALDRAMTKLQIEPRTRAALVKYALSAGQDASSPAVAEETVLRR